MKEFENNAFFWQKLETLLMAGQIVITKKKGETHFEYNNLIYPTDYGYLKSTNETDVHTISVYRGSLKQEVINSVVVAVDILKKDIDAKILCGCSELEEEEILRFLNQTDFQKTIIFRKGIELPAWATSN